MLKTCKQCGTGFKNRARVLCCSIRCGALWRIASGKVNTAFTAKMLREYARTCIKCLYEFSSKSPSAKVCRTCKEKRQCKECGASIAYKPLHHVTCSLSCHAKWQYQNNPRFRNPRGPDVLQTPEARRKRGLAQRGKAKPSLRKKNPSSPARNIAYNRADYREWRRSVFERDNYTCQHCKVRGGYLEAHHVKTWAEYPDERYNVANGLTVCRKCHAHEHGRRCDGRRGSTAKKARFLKHLRAS